MKVRNNALKSSLITNPHENMRPSSEKKKGFINSIRKINILSSIKTISYTSFNQIRSNTIPPSLLKCPQPHQFVKKTN